MIIKKILSILRWMIWDKCERCLHRKRDVFHYNLNIGKKIYVGAVCDNCLGAKKYE